MFVLFIFFLGIYLGVVHLVAFIRKKLNPGTSLVGTTVGALAGYGAAMTVTVAAVILVESDEAYWYYGPNGRFDALLLFAAGLSLLFLILGPIVSIRLFRKRARAPRE